MIRYVVILVLICYSFHLELQLSIKTNSFSSLYRTCEKTTGMIEELETMIKAKQVKYSKLSFYKKTNQKLLYNYRNCIGALDKKQQKLNWLANNP